MKVYFLLFLSTVVTSCYYDSKEYLFSEVNDSCDTTNIGFENTVNPLLATYCLNCHSNASATGSGNGIRLEEYADVKTSAVDGSLLGAIRHEASYTPMPIGGSKLDDCSVRQLELWVEKNYPEK